MTKSELLNWLQNEYQQWAASIEQIGAERMEQPGVAAHWSVKDIIAHLNGWQRKFNDHLQAAQRGDPQPPPPWPEQLQEEDEINEWIYESGRGRSVRELLDESQQLLQQLFALVEGLPDDVQIDEIRHGRSYYLVWVGGERFPIGEFFDHFYDDHEPDIRAWLEQGEQQ